MIIVISAMDLIQQRPTGALKRACLEYKSVARQGDDWICPSCRKSFRQDCMCLRHRVSRRDNVPISKFSGSANLSESCKDELSRCEALCRNCEAERYRSSRKPTALKRKALAHCGGSCTKCGYSDCAAALEFHHVDGRGAPTKRLTLGQRGLKHFSEIVEELN